MKSFKALAFIVLADLAFQMSNGLVAGYYFMTLKEQVASHAELDNLKKKGIEVPRLDAGVGGEPDSVSQNSIEIMVPREGKQFVIGGRSVPKTELDEMLEDMKDSTCVVSVDKQAPSGDTIFLFDMLNRHNLKIKIMYLGGQ
jgi:hypothetical protein